jgi:hypothetical protein
MEYLSIEGFIVHSIETLGNNLIITLIDKLKPLNQFIIKGFNYKAMKIFAEDNFLPLGHLRVIKEGSGSYIYEVLRRLGSEIEKYAELRIAYKSENTTFNGFYLQAVAEKFVIEKQEE